nr:hypothetical protein [Tanacetum cinerariifolium]
MMIKNSQATTVSKIIADEEGVTIDAIPLAVKPPCSVDWKIKKEGKKSYYKIIRADGSLKIYLNFSHMLKEFNKEDVETLKKLVNAKYGSTRPEGDYERVIWGDLKVMFKPHIEDEVWKMQQSIVEKEVNAAQIQVTAIATTPIISIDEATFAQALAELKYTKPKAKPRGIVFHEPKESTTTTVAIPKSKSQDKGRAKMIKEPTKLKKKDQIQLDEEIESWDDVQEKIDADYQLAERMQAEEQQELNNEEKAKLFMQLLEKKRKFFAAKKAEEKSFKPPTQAQQRKIMCTYLKNMEGKKLTNLKNMSFDSIQKMFNRAFKRVNTFVNYRTELVEESSKKHEAEVTEGTSKRARTELEQENAKKLVY